MNIKLSPATNLIEERVFYPYLLEALHRLYGGGIYYDVLEYVAGKGIPRDLLDDQVGVNRWLVGLFVSQYRWVKKQNKLDRGEN